LKVEYRVSAKGNSGINYRSVQITNSPFALRGYQSDIDGANKYTGQNYEEKGRTFLALRGDVSRVDADGKSRIIGSVGDKVALAAFIKNEDWNEVHLIVRGNTITHLVNGHVMSVVVDDDAERRKFDGLLGIARGQYPIVLSPQDHLPEYEDHLVVFHKQYGLRASQE
jgi:hypothetical protein